MEKFKIEFKWAMVFSLSLLFWMYFEKIMGWHSEKIKFQPIYTMLFGFVAVIIYVFAILDKKKNHFNGTQDWKKGFLSGAILSLLIAAFNPIVQYLSYEVISLNFFTNIISSKIEHKRMSLIDAEKYFTLSNYIYFSTFSSLSYGIVTASIVAYFVKSKTN
tara:strand:+ start:720 stop:1202 length:483 start_codon:yes stop_codon:yes gene_type:complete